MRKDKTVKSAVIFEQLWCNRPMQLHLKHLYFKQVQ